MKAFWGRIQSVQPPLQSSIWNSMAKIDYHLGPHSIFSTSYHAIYANTIISFRPPRQSTTIPLRKTRNFMLDSNLMVPATTCAKILVKH